MPARPGPARLRPRGVAHSPSAQACRVRPAGPWHAGLSACVLLGCAVPLPTSCLSRPRHTTQEQRFDVLIQYPHHPRAGERVAVVRRLQHGGSSHFVIEQPDGTRTLLPVWMTEPWTAQIAIVKKPRLTLEALFTLRRTIDGALLSSSPATPMRGECDARPTSQPPTARSARSRGQRARIEPNSSGGSGGK